MAPQLDIEIERRRGGVLEWVVICGFTQTFVYQVSGRPKFPGASTKKFHSRQYEVL